MMRRKHMRRRSPTNSRPHEDAELRHKYLNDNPLCELCKHNDSIEPHHICAGRPKVDAISNLIATCRGCHDEAQPDPVISKLRCWEIKLAKDEFIEAEVDLALRMRVRGWLDLDRVKLVVADTEWEDVRLHLAEHLEFRRG